MRAPQKVASLLICVPVRPVYIPGPSIGIIHVPVQERCQ